MKKYSRILISALLALVCALGVALSAPEVTASPQIAPEPTPVIASTITDPLENVQYVINYLDAYGKLPDYYLKKKQAKKLGWNAKFNFVGDILPGMAIGGDTFKANYRDDLPLKDGRTWHECDIAYMGKERNAYRLVYSSDGLYFYTDNHYKTFTQMYPEESDDHP